MSLSIGCSPNEQVEITVEQYQHSPSSESFDDNWLICSVSVSFGSFSGKFSASFQTYDFVKFSKEIQKLYVCLKGTATFDSLEGQLEIKLIGNGRGGIELEGNCMDSVGVGNELKFSTGFDQTYLQSIIEDLDEILEGFPVRAL
ncbi:WapI family immunity protein [Shewanella frigidimarina]|jgi:hypothetical protein|uniref:Uncharacterized protein n=1 Tax=Shewanella frigidimarina (strain NCIMB 400) TaxID=318167 RepID=Q07XF0_SHEFN|nr:MULTISPECIES: hypothetical protein [Shewanella]ABI73314.1 hypothetical protein Sfri_3485 [Shewanella frigidimarina NCIMB 400]MBB1364530.1 hypothetical protein [Shewanella sp. SR44-4]RPA33866.1 hypothetical protein EGC79_20200 [Shewanella vesiculosa]UJL41131.1 hypothetical protein KDH10_002046 [Shewanella vesiculosa]|tara:strand:- start:1291 stop:1722 length:432 start_codon:yes stop_codon:yes gene_type:complete